VDDVKRDRERYAKKLSSRNFQLQPIPFEDEHTVMHIIQEKPDVVLLDQELVEGPPDERPEARLGSTVAALIREELPETPIVLITRGSIFKSETMSASRDVPRAYDHVLVKASVGHNPEAARNEILTIVTGFHDIRQCADRSWAGLCNLLGAEEGDIESLARSNPPRSYVGTEAWRASEAAHWIRQTVIQYPGILYDSLHAACFLGMALDSFTLPGMQRYFSKAKYKGAFAPVGGRWWKARLRRTALEFMQKAGKSAVSVHDFEVTRSEHSTTKLTPSRCLVDGTSPAESVCFIYERPVKRKHSVPYWPDNRPDIMDEARVSFNAVRESGEFDENLVMLDAREIVDELQQRS
jgi:hypothetical protein